MHRQPIVAILACHSGPSRGGRERGGAHQVVRQARRRRARPASVRADADAARRHAAEGAPLLLEERVPPRGIEPALCERIIAHAARIPSPHSAVILFQIEGALNAPSARPLAGRQPRRALRAQRGGRVGAGGRRRGQHRMGALDVERHEAVLDRRHLHQLPDRTTRARSAPWPRWARPCSGWPRSRRSGIRRTCSAPTATSCRPGDPGDEEGCGPRAAGLSLAVG